jgi:carboxylate-amine ligase
MSATFVGGRSAVPIAVALNDLIELLLGDAQQLNCVNEVLHAMEVLKHGSSADKQLRVYELARAAGRGRLQALKAVVDWVHRQTTAEGP